MTIDSPTDNDVFLAYVRAASWFASSSYTFS